MARASRTPPLQDVDDALRELALLPLRDALGDPDDVPDFLFLQAEVAVERAVPSLRRAR